MKAKRIPLCPDDRRRQAFTLIELLVVLAVIGILAALLLPLLSRAKARALNTVCVSQLRQLGIATRLYAADNNSKLPVAERLPSMPLYANQTLPRICDLLGPYAGKTGGSNASARVFKCPADREGYFEVEGSSYMWNAGLNGKRIDSDQDIHFAGFGNDTNFVPVTMETNITLKAEFNPVLFDYDDFHPRPPKSGRNVVFMDDHVTPLEATGQEPIKNLVPLATHRARNRARGIGRNHPTMAARPADFRAHARAWKHNKGGNRTSIRRHLRGESEPSDSLDSSTVLARISI